MKKEYPDAQGGIDLETFGKQIDFFYFDEKDNTNLKLLHDDHDEIKTKKNCCCCNLFNVFVIL